MGADDEEDPVGPFVPEATVAPLAATAPELLFTSEESNVTPAEPDPDAINPVLTAPAVDPVRGWRAESAEPMAATRSERARFGGLALILATLVGAVFGFAAGYMARPRALQSGPPPEIAAAGADNELKATASAPTPAPGTSETKKAPTSAPKAPKAPEAPTKIGRLLVRSTPSGASVEVDGVARGVTPLALQELDLGAREITVSRPGYVSEERRIVLTKARPSRSVEVRLSPPEPPKPAPSTARESGPRPATPASLGKPAGVTGALAIESRPSGAAVTVNDKPSGTTPVTISDLPPGDYRVTISLPGYRPFATTVRVVAGERARAAARLTEQEQE
jgi:PEGA domain